MAIEIVGLPYLPINSMVIFHSYVNVYQRVNQQLDPENDQFIVVSLVFQPLFGRVELLIY